MEPLRDLAVLKKWNAYVPSTNGYTSAPLGSLSDMDIPALLGCLERLKPNGTIAGAHVLTGAPSPGISVNNKTLPMPMSDSDFKFLLEFGDATATGGGAYMLSRNKVRITNTSWARAVKEGSKEAMGHAGMDSELLKKIKLVGLTVVEPQVGGVHSLDTRLESEKHLATVFVVLPSHRSSATFEARHGGLEVIHDLTTSALFAPHLIVCYPGVESATLATVQDEHVAYLTYQLYFGDDADPLPPLLADLSLAAFAGWAHALSMGSSGGGIPKGHIIYQLDAAYIKKGSLFSKKKSFADVTSITNAKDRLILSHLAPAAKHFKFRILLGHAFITQRSYIGGGYDGEDSEPDYDVNDYGLDDGSVETEVNWIFTGLDGKVVKNEALDTELYDTLTARVEEQDLKDGETNSILNYHVDTDKLDGKDLEAEPERFGRTSLTLTHGRHSLSSALHLALSSERTRRRDPEERASRNNPLPLPNLKRQRDGPGVPNPRAHLRRRRL
ncbi:hypothetical protein DFP72DRAFT_882177 [Ephemerocybe angulata]|uniref:Uncharacterized protein n=1 Tax=Ephemerocybe angulata TaxID=980116 RepID=A0A8H6I9P3_9AGAR|nr:hypothetical protein DFP72DRAFT_882177 [Tulosesus angulatus]